MVRLLVRSSGGSDLHWLVVRFRGVRPAPTGGRSLSKASTLLRGEDRRAWAQGQQLPAPVSGPASGPHGTRAPAAAHPHGPWPPAPFTQVQGDSKRQEQAGAATPPRAAFPPRTPPGEDPVPVTLQGAQGEAPQEATGRRAGRSSDVTGADAGGGPWAGTLMGKPLLLSLQHPARRRAQRWVGTAAHAVSAV